MPEVAPRKTTATELEALSALARAFAHVFGRRPVQGELAVLWVQSAHETNGWRNMPNWNPSGIKAGKSYAGDWRPAKTKEGHGASEVEVVERFRAYGSLELGMRDWLRILRDGYPLACAGARVGSVEAFVVGLLEGWGRSLDYFTADPREYLAASEAWAKKLATLPIAWADVCAPDGSSDGDGRA